MGSYLKLARRLLGKDREAFREGRAALRAERATSPLDATPGRRQLFDRYVCRAKTILLEVCEHDYPDGMIPWLEQADPRLYSELTSRLPRKIERLWEDLGPALWEDLAPFDEFERALQQFLHTHREACAIYHRHLSEKPKGARTIELERKV